MLDFPVIKLLDWKPRREELETSRNPFAMVVAAHLATMETRPHQVRRKDLAVELCRVLASRGFPQAVVDGLFHAVEAMMTMTDDLYEAFEKEVARIEEVANVHVITRSERKGLEKGIEKGLALGREEGRREAILDFAVARFGKVPRGLQAALEKVSDLEALQRLTQVVATAESPQELLEAIQGESGA